MGAQATGMALPAILLGCSVCVAPSAPPDSASAQSSSVAMEAAVDVKAGGTRVEHSSVLERRVEPIVSVQATRAVVISVGVPVLFRDYDRAGETSSAVVPGDASISADVRLVNVEDGLSHRVWLSPEIKAPTAPVATDAEGAPDASALQPGCSSVMPRLAALYAFGQGLWTVQLRGSIAIPFAVREAPHRGTLATAGADVVIDPWSAAALRLGAWWLFETSGADERGESDPSSGGVTGYATIAVEARWTSYLRASASVDLPVVRALAGDQGPTPIGSFRLTGHWDIAAKSREAPVMATAPIQRY